FHERQAVAVLWIHICVNLEYETGEFLFIWFYQAGVAFLWPWGRGYFNETVQQFANAEIIQRRTKKYRLQFSFQIFPAVKIGVHFIHQLELFLKGFCSFSAN